MKAAKKHGKFMSTVKVGTKGQIVIPKEVRDMFSIEAGDTLLLLADENKGIAIERYNVFAKIADSIFAGKARELYPVQSEEDSQAFAEKIKELSEGENERD